SLFFYPYADPRVLPSFPTRRSSDLLLPYPVIPTAAACSRSSAQARRGSRRFVRILASAAAARFSIGSLSVIAHGSAIWSSRRWQDRKSTRLNSRHDQISYAVFC